MNDDRLKRLAGSIDGLAAKDELALKQAREIAAARARAAATLHAVCAGFVNRLNKLLTNTRAVLDPPEYGEQNFRDDSVNLVQINVQGRIMQVEFESTPELISREDFRVPYTLAGSVRCFNQQLLDQDLMVEHLLFFCYEPARCYWRFFDERTYRSGPFDEAYLISLMELLV